MVTAFFVLVGLLIYVYLAFPTVMMLLATFERRRPSMDYEPSVAVLIPAANERSRIAAKLANTLASRYPAGKLQVLVADDGSTDGTPEAVLAVGDPRVQLITLAAGGKTSALNRLVQVAGADILVMSDADVLIGPTAIRDLVRRFADPRVGAVCGQRSSRAEAVSEESRPARFHYRYESALKRGEGVLGRVLGGDGSLYALRRSAFRPLPPNVPDDFVNVLRVLEAGMRVEYENRAVSWEELAPAAVGDFVRRRRRTVARGIRGLWSVRGLLNPLRFPLVSFLLVSHKVLRWGAGFILAVLLALNALLAARPGFRELLLAQAAFYAAALAGAWIPGNIGKPLRMARYFILSNLAATAGVVDVIARRDWTRWSLQRSSSSREP